MSAAVKSGIDTSGQRHRKVKVTCYFVTGRGSLIPELVLTSGAGLLPRDGAATQWHFCSV